MTSKSRISSRTAIAFLVPLLLAACQAPQTGGSWQAATSPRPATPHGGAAEADLAPAAPGVAPSTADLIADPSRFKGLSGTDVTALLGAPSFQRQDGDAEIWQYYGPLSICVLDLFVYPEQGQRRVAHAELRLRGAGKADGCMADILNGKRG